MLNFILYIYVYLNVCTTENEINNAVDCGKTANIKKQPKEKRKFIIIHTGQNIARKNSVIFAKLLYRMNNFFRIT